MATNKPIYQTVGDAYANNVRDKQTIGSYRNTGINGYQNTGGAPKLSQVALDAQKRNAELYAAQQASKPPLSFGDKVATPNVGGAGPTPEEFARMNAGASTVDQQYANGVRDEKVIGSFNPDRIITNEDAAKAVAGIATPTPVVTPTPTPVSEATSTATSDMDKRIAELQNAINARYEDMMNQARKVSRMNQSSITGNLGRVFGANADTSEAAPVITENNRLNTNLQTLGNARNQALSELSLQALNKAQEQLRYEQQQQASAQQQAFNNLIAEAGLTGTYNGQQTLEGRQQGLNEQQQQFLRAIQEAGLTGTYNGALTQDAIQNIAGLTGYFNGMPTLDREQANLVNQQKTLNDYLDYIASTTNNQNTNQTKLTNTQLLNSGKIDLANINNTADMEQLIKTLFSKENIASMNNTSRTAIAEMNNNARAALLREKVANGTATTSELTENQAYANYTKALETNSIFPGTIPDETINALKARIDSFQKKN